jgi:hypothetical protein
MGHLRLGRLPKSKQWLEVIKMLEDSASAPEDIAARTFYALETGLADMGKDEGLVTTFWLLTRLTDAATKEDFAVRLKQSGLDVPADPSLFDIASALNQYINDHTSRAGRRSDIAEMAASAAVECLTSMCSADLGSLFDTTPSDVRKSIARLSTKTNFSKLGHEFFSRFVNRYAGYLLSRELSNHVGPNKRFQDIKSYSDFNEALNLHCRQSTRIIDEFAGGWYSKKVYEDQLTMDNAAGFVQVALKKLRSEFRRGSGIE